MLLEFSAANPERNWECLKHGSKMLRWASFRCIPGSGSVSGIMWTHHSMSIASAVSVHCITQGQWSNVSKAPVLRSWCKCGMRQRACTEDQTWCLWVKNEKTKSKSIYQQQQQDYIQIWTEATQHPTAICQVEAKTTWGLITQNDSWVLKALIVIYCGWRQMSCDILASQLEQNAPASCI